MKKYLIFLFVFLGIDAYAYITTDMIGGCNASNQDFAPAGMWGSGQCGRII